MFNVTDYLHFELNSCESQNIPGINPFTVIVVGLEYCDYGVASKQTRHTEGQWDFIFMMAKAKVPTCSCPSARNMKQE